MLNLGQDYANLLLQGGPGQIDVESSRFETENKFYAGLLMITFHFLIFMPPKINYPTYKNLFIN